MGTQPLVYTDLNGGFVFGSTSDALLQHPKVKANIDPKAIYNYVYFHVVPSPQTTYREINRLSPGNHILFNDVGLTQHNYYRTHYIDAASVDFHELQAQFISILQNSIRKTINGATNVGTFLSGGTDSSTITGVLSEITGGPVRTYSIGFNAEGYDEMEYARIVSSHFNTNHHEYYVTPDDVIAIIPKIADIYDNPFGNASAVPTYYCAHMAKEDGIDILLGGDGGDELFGGNAHYAKQWLFSIYEYIPKLLRDWLIEPSLKHAPFRTQIGFIRKACSYVQQAAIPMPARLESYNLLNRIGPENVFTSEFLQAADVKGPLSLLKKLYEQADSQNIINRMLDIDMRLTLADNDLLKVTKMCELAGVEARFPLLTDEMVRFAADLPADLKLKRTQLRFFFKQALQNFLPSKVLNKKKHGFGLPFGLWLRQHGPLREFTFECITDLKRYQIVKPKLIDDLIKIHLKDHTSYYGTLVWVLIMLEQWLQRRSYQSIS